MNLGNGDGTFKLGTKLSVSYPYILAVADFNGDGKPDVLEQGTGTLLVLLGNGDGTFQAPISSPSGASLTPVAAIDLTGTGKADVVGVFNNQLLVYLSKGDGTFASEVSYNLGLTPVGTPVLSFGDFNGDGKVDVVVTLAGNNVAGEELVFLGKGDGTFQATPKSSAGVSYAGYAAVGDFNGDGKLDIAIAGSTVCTPSCSGSPATFILLGNGDGTFQAPAGAFPESGPLAAADVNGDGKLDLVIQPDTTVSRIYLGNGNGTFSNFSNYVLTMPFEEGGVPVYGVASSQFAIADFNGDGKPDIAASNAVLLGDGNGNFQSIPLGVVPNSIVQNDAGAAVTGVFNKSSSPGVAVLSNQEIGTTYYYNLYILANNGKGVLTLAHNYTLQQPYYTIVTADLNGDGNLDLLLVGTDPTTGDWIYTVLLGNGDGSFQAPNSYLQSVTGSQGYSVVVADFNNDKRPDVAISMTNGTFAVLLGKGNGTFEAPSYVFDGGTSLGVANLLAADFNGDGKVDIAAGGVSSNTEATAILLGNGDGTFQAAVFPQSLSQFSAEFTADINHNGKPDLVSFDQVALGNGDGTFALLPPIAGVGVSAIADFNGDGKLDLLVDFFGSESLLGNGVMLGNGDGTFSSPVSFPSDEIVPVSVLIADMNADGRPDIIFPWETSVNGIGVLLNTTPASFQLSATALSPAIVNAGSAATSTITVTPNFGFSGTVMLACQGLPTGASCAFNPSSISNSSGTSTLTITTGASTAPLNYTVQIQGSSGSVADGVAVVLQVQPPVDFVINPLAGSSQTISAGQSASFTVEVAPTGGFTGTVNLDCAVKPVVTPGPTCDLSISTVQIGGTSDVTVKVGTTAPVTSGTALYPEFPSGLMPAAWISTLIASAWLWGRKRKRLLALAAAITATALALCLGCGGNGSSTHTTGGTPPGTYTATVTATSGSLSHNTALQVIVQ